MARAFFNKICTFALGSALLSFAYCQSQQYYYPSNDYGNQYQGDGSYYYGDGRSNQQSNEEGIEFPGRYSQGGDYRLPNSTDWDYYQSWRNYRESYYRGDTQPQAYRESHPYGTGGIGYDPDPTYLRMEETYRRLNAQEQQGGNPYSQQGGGGGGGGYYRPDGRYSNDAQQQGEKPGIGATQKNNPSRRGGGGGSNRRNSGKFQGGGSPRKYPYAERSKNYEDYWDYSR